MRATLERNVVREFVWECRDIGYGIESGATLGYWTGEVDTWGKYAVRDATGGPTLYLFPDEIVEQR